MKKLTEVPGNVGTVIYCTVECRDDPHSNTELFTENWSLNRQIIPQLQMKTATQISQQINKSLKSKFPFSLTFKIVL